MFGAEIDWITAKQILKNDQKIISQFRDGRKHPELSSLNFGKGYLVETSAVLSKTKIQGHTRYIIFGYDDQKPDVMRFLEKHAIHGKIYPIHHGHHHIGRYSVRDGWQIKFNEKRRVG